eukprot:8633993-Alexandrium_andersonii.AAC.1
MRAGALAAFRPRSRRPRRRGESPPRELRHLVPRPGAGLGTPRRAGRTARTRARWRAPRRGRE